MAPRTARPAGEYPAGRADLLLPRDPAL